MLSIYCSISWVAAVEVVEAVTIGAAGLAAAVVELPVGAGPAETFELKAGKFVLEWGRDRTAISFVEVLRLRSSDATNSAQDDRRYRVVRMIEYSRVYLEER